MNKIKNVGDNMNCDQNFNKKYSTNNIINWSDKVKHLDETIKKEIGMEDDDVETKHILIKVQTKSSETIEPAFIVNEDEVFLDLFVLSPQGPGVTSTAVLKNNIQSIGVIGGISTEKPDSNEISDESPVFEDISRLYQ